MHYYDNPKGMIPAWLINWAAQVSNFPLTPLPSPPLPPLPLSPITLRLLHLVFLLLLLLLLPPPPLSLALLLPLPPPPSDRSTQVSRHDEKRSTWLSQVSRGQEERAWSGDIGQY